MSIILHIYVSGCLFQFTLGVFTGRKEEEEEDIRRMSWCDSDSILTQNHSKSHTPPPKRAREYGACKRNYQKKPPSLFSLYFPLFSLFPVY